LYSGSLQLAASRSIIIISIPKTLMIYLSISLARITNLLGFAKRLKLGFGWGLLTCHILRWENTTPKSSFAKNQPQFNLERAQLRSPNPCLSTVWWCSWRLGLGDIHGINEEERLEDLLFCVPTSSFGRNPRLNLRFVINPSHTTD
jgi:hypothetical protein